MSMDDRDPGGLEPTIHVALAAAAVSAGVASYFGLRDAMGGAGAAEGVIVPLVMSVAVAVGAWTLWRQLLLLACRSMVAHRRMLLLSLGLSLALVIAALSSWWIAAAIGGQDALRHHEHEHLQALRHALDDAHRQRLREQELVPVLRRVAAALHMEAENERDGHGESGKPGHGPVARAARDAASDFGDLATRVEDAVDQANRLQRAAAEQMELVQHRIADLGPAAMQAEIVGVTGQVNRVVGELQTGHVAPAVERFGVVIGEGGPGISSEQRDAFRGLNVRLEKHTATAHAAARQLGDAKRAVVVPPYQLTNTALAVWNRAHVVPGACIVGVAVDLLPFVLLLVLSLRVAAAEQPWDGRPAVRRGARDTAHRGLRDGRPSALESWLRSTIDGVDADVDGRRPNGQRAADDEDRRAGRLNGNSAPEGGTASIGDR
jgi:hypothetical protein